MNFKSIIVILVILFIFARPVYNKVIDWGADAVGTVGKKVSQQVASETVNFPSSKYPKTAAHIKKAISSGKSSVCTIDREGADNNRKQSLKGIATKSGFDRDEWPMAMCAEGGKGADVAYVKSSDNRGSGAWMGNKMRQYPDGTRVKIVVE